jgi:hypothetical protein
MTKAAPDQVRDLLPKTGALIWTMVKRQPTEMMGYIQINCLPQKDGNIGTLRTSKNRSLE